jgi:hypothetical protein
MPSSFKPVRQRLLAALNWSTQFADPIILPNGRKLVTLKDAATLEKGPL